MGESEVVDSMCCNVVLVGKTGAGKSTLGNYLFDDGTTVFPAGKGKPVTGWKDNFRSRTMVYAGTPIQIYDTVGVEPDNLARWKGEFRRFLDERSPANDGSTQPYQWLSGVFVLSNANDARFENWAISIVQTVAEKKVPVHIVLTNTDKAGPDKIRGMQERIAKVLPGCPLHLICSVSERTRKGTSYPSGREELLAAFLKGAHYSISHRLLLRMLDEIESAVRTGLSETRTRLKQQKINVLNPDSLDALDDVFEVLNDLDIDTQMDALSQYEDFLDSFHVDFQRDVDFDQYLESFEELLEDMGQVSAKLHSLETAMDNLESEDVLEKIRGILTMLGTAAAPKATIMKVLREVEQSMCDKLNEIRQQVYAGME